MSIYPDDGHDAETLIKNADIAMYHAKKNWSRSYRFFKPEMAPERVELQSDGQDSSQGRDWQELESGLGSGVRGLR